MRTSFPKDKISVLLLEGIHERAVALFDDEGFQVRAMPKAADPADLPRLLDGVHLLGIRSRTHLTPEILAAAPRLLGVGCFCIGTNQVDLPAARRQAIPVFNAPHSNTRSVAELTIAEIVALHRRLGDRSAACHAGRWDKSAAGSHEIRGKTLGIVGYGHIGSQVSVLAEAMGMRVVFYDVVPKQALGNARAAASLDALLAQSDVVTIHVPATPLTENLIGPAQIAAMKPGAMLINNARGGVVDEPALCEAIRAGRVGGAAVDVFTSEPAGAADAFDSPLRGLPNVILTPHIGGSTAEAQESIGLDVATKLVRFVNTGGTTGAVNVPEVALPEQPPPDAVPDDAERPHRILHFHRNVPGVLGRINSAVAALGVNVEGQYLRTREDLGYVVLDVAPTDSERLREALESIEETVRVRLLW
ncbi:MAG: phosphoglycerate dehydrogenase [Phycisphaerales bacterium]